jgi:hypothetical protein
MRGHGSGQRTLRNVLSCGRRESRAAVLSEEGSGSRAPASASGASNRQGASRHAYRLRVTRSRRTQKRDSRRYLGPVRDALKDEAERLLRLLYRPLTTA